MQLDPFAKNAPDASTSAPPRRALASKIHVRNSRLLALLRGCLNPSQASRRTETAACDVYNFTLQHKRRERTVASADRTHSTLVSGRPVCRKKIHLLTHLAHHPPHQPRVALHQQRACHAPQKNRRAARASPTLSIKRTFSPRAPSSARNLCAAANQLKRDARVHHAFRKTHRHALAMHGHVFATLPAAVVNVAPLSLRARLARAGPSFTRLLRGHLPVRGARCAGFAR